MPELHGKLVVTVATAVGQSHGLDIVESRTHSGTMQVEQTVPVAVTVGHEATVPVAVVVV